MSGADADSCFGPFGDSSAIPTKMSKKKTKKIAIKKNYLQRFHSLGFVNFHPGWGFIYIVIILPEAQNV